MACAGDGGGLLLLVGAEVGDDWLVKHEGICRGAGDLVGWEEEEAAEVGEEEEEAGEAGEEEEEDGGIFCIGCVGGRARD